VRMCAEVIREPFMLTYGDGVADIDIKALITQHRSNCPTVTATAVHPPARFGQLVIAKDDYVKQFNEKAIGQHEWINGGFFVVDDYIPDFNEPSWEFDILPRMVRDELLVAYRHTGFWQCMDTQRDVDYLNQLVQEGRAPWLS
jgi:glucose-1-phosphate cytidylyltransferase